MKDSFSNMHPVTNLVFFAAVIIFSMFNMHPVCLALSLLCALANAVVLSGKKAVLFSIKFLLPTALFLMLINPLFNHRGSTILLYFPWGNPLTLESVLYGAATAALVSAVALWFHCFHRVMTSDKLIFLFGRLAPSLGLVLSMALRFIPRFTAQFRLTRQSQRQITSCGKTSLTGRIKAIARVFSVMVSWSMENAIETADSMKGRGYGLRGRTMFSRFRFQVRDAATTAFLLTDVAVLVLLRVFGGVKYRYFPAFFADTGSLAAVMFYILYAVLFITPPLINVGEELRWKRLQSKI